MKMEITMVGDYQQLIESICGALLKATIGNKVVESSEYDCQDTKVAIRVIEKFAYAGSERITTTLVFVYHNGLTRLTALVSGYEGILFLRSPNGKKAQMDKIEAIIKSLNIETITE